MRRLCDPFKRLLFCPETYPEGFQGKQLNKDETVELSVIAAVFYAKNAIRANTLLNDDSIKCVPTGLQHWELVVKVEDGISSSFPSLSTSVCHGVQVKDSRVNVEIVKDSDVFIATVEGQRIRVPDNFTLADLVVSPELNGTKTVVQLIGRQPNGTMTIRYHGMLLLVTRRPTQNGFSSVCNCGCY